MLVLQVVYACVGLVGILFLLLSWFLGDVGEAVDQVFDGVDGVLDSLGIDSDLSDNDGESKGLGCSTIFPFMAGFGSVGYAVSISGIPALYSIIWAVIAGIAISGLYIILMRFFYRQQSNSLVSDQDFIGLKGHSTINSPAGEVGQVSLVINGEIRPFPAMEKYGKELNYNDQIEVIEYSGGLLYVKNLSR